MNAPDTITALRQEKFTANAPPLVAWNMIRTLVGFDTTSRESNLALIDWVQHYLESHGAQCTLLHLFSGQNVRRPSHARAEGTAPSADA